MDSNTVLAAYAPGHMLEVKWKVALYVDERANAQGQLGCFDSNLLWPGGRASGGSFVTAHRSKPRS